MRSVLISSLAIIGGITVLSVTSALLYYTYTGELRPNISFRNAMGEIRYSYVIALFVLPAVITGSIELDWDGVIFGLLIGFGFILYIIMIQWIMGPI